MIPRLSRRAKQSQTKQEEAREIKKKNEKKTIKIMTTEKC